jgi:hypothetical protein
MVRFAFPVPGETKCYESDEMWFEHTLIDGEEWANGLAHLPPIIAKQLTLKTTFSTK